MCEVLECVDETMGNPYNGARATVYHFRADGSLIEITVVDAKQQVAPLVPRAGTNANIDADLNEGLSAFYRRLDEQPQDTIAVTNTTLIDEKPQTPTPRPRAVSGGASWFWWLGIVASLLWAVPWTIVGIPALLFPPLGILLLFNAVAPFLYLMERRYGSTRPR